MAAMPSKAGRFRGTVSWGTMRSMAGAGRFAGKVALVTGAASGIGRATVARLVAEGARMVATDIVDVPSGDGTVVLRHDVTDEGAWRAAVDAAERRFGGLDVLVNAAGILAHGTIEDTTLADWRRMMDVNLYGSFLGCRVAMPALERNGGGAIVNISSVAGLKGTPDILAYGASKGGVRSLTKAVARDGAARKAQVRCNSVHPGVIATPMVADYFAARANAAETERAWRRSQPAGTFGSAEDVAAMIAFVLSDDAAFVTGAEFVVDGAMTA